MILAIRRPGGSGPPPVGGSTYSYLEPVYTLPTGMTYNAATGMVEGETFSTTYSAPATEVNLTDAGTRAANYSALSSAIATAAASGSGTRIMCAVGADFGGNYDLPVNSSSGWIYIETRAIKDSTFISETTRATSSHISSMPHMYSTGIGHPNSVVFHLPQGNNKYRFTGLHLAFAPSGVSWNSETSSTTNCAAGFISVNDTNGTDVNVATDVIVDRCFVSGIDGKNLKRGLWLNGIRSALINSTIDEVRQTVTAGASDGQGLLITDGIGPYKIHNNHFRVGAMGEHLMVGGGVNTTLPADGQITNNHFEFPTAWFSALDIKNLGEHKCGLRWLWQGNVFSNYRTTSIGSQYFTINFKTSDDLASQPSTETRDITFRMNDLVNCSGGFLIATDPNNNAVDANRVELTCNRLRVNSTDYSAAERSWGLQISSNMAAFSLRHNSLYCTANTSYAIVEANESAGNMGTHVYTDNFFAMKNGAPTNGWIRPADGAWSDGITTWNNLQGSGTYTGNGVSMSTTLPSNNTTCADLATADCASSTGGSLALNPTSPLKGTAASGRDPGAVHGLIDSAISGVV